MGHKVLFVKGVFSIPSITLSKIYIPSLSNAIRYVIIDLSGPFVLSKEKKDDSISWTEMHFTLSDQEERFTSNFNTEKEALKFLKETFLVFPDLERAFLFDQSSRSGLLNINNRASILGENFEY